MKTMISREDEQLLNYLDGTLDAQQASKMEEQVRQSQVLKVRLEELRLVHAALKAGAQFETPSRNFTQRVMTRLDSLPATQGFSPRNGILLLSGILVAIVISLMLLQAGMFNSFNGSIALDTLPVKKDWVKSPLPSIPLNGKFLVNLILLVATGLSFVLLDRTILRPFFGRRSGMQL